MRILTFLVASVCSATLFAQLNLTQLGHRSYNQELSDVWGYATGGNEYAIVGVFNGTSIVDVTTPASPAQLHFIPGPNSTWRDMKVWGDYAFVTNESDSGLLIIDMTGLPSTINYKHWFGNNGVSFSSAHNIFIDEQGYGYIVGANTMGGGAIVVDLFTDPWNPDVQIVYDLAYIHDIFVRGDTMWNAQISAGNFNIVDISDKAPNTVPASKVLGTQNTPDNFTHNCWLSADGNFLFTTDEVSGAFLAAYDVSDPQNITEVDRLQSNPGSGVIPHNTFWIDNFLVTSYYRDGVHITDVTQPNNMVEMGFFDTSPGLSGTGFNGCWGVYPYLPSGNILATDIENGLYILGPTYQQACYLRGNVTDSATTFPISNSDVTVSVAAYANTTSDILGDYRTGFQIAGTYDVTFSKLGYYPKTITGVSVAHGVTTTLDVELRPQIPFLTRGSVTDSITGQGIDGAQVLFVADNATYTATCDVNGDYTVSNMFENTYDIYAGSWGYWTKAKNSFLAGSNVDFELAPGYYDDFILDFNWTETGNAVRGEWERGEPVGTSFGGPSNPDFDVTGDFGDQAYVTGNGGGGAGSDDVDNGNTVLTSPSFDLDTYLYPAIHYYRWFFNAGGQGFPNDSLIITLDNGTSSAVVDLAENGDGTESQWTQHRILVNDFLTPSSTMTITVETFDRQGSGHLVEGGFDFFYVFDSLHAPVADFTADVIVGCAPMTVNFTDMSVQATSWDWQMPGSVEGNSTDQNPSATYMSPGTYNVTLKVTNVAGEDSITKTTFITVNESPTVAMSSTPDNGSGNGTATAAASGASAPYSYNWSNAQTTETATGLASGTYFVTVTDNNGCTTVDSVVVEFITGIDAAPALSWVVSPNPSKGDFVIVFTGDLTNVRGELHSITGQLVRSWSSIQHELIIAAPPSAGVYALTLFDGTGSVAHIRLVSVE